MDSSKTSNESNDEGSTSKGANGYACGKKGKRQQFTSKQRMDMYAFCVLELEMHSNKVSIKKRQLAIQKVLKYKQEQNSSSSTSGVVQESNSTNSSHANQEHVTVSQNIDSAQQNATPTILSTNLSNQDLSVITQPALLGRHEQQSQLTLVSNLDSLTSDTNHNDYLINSVQDSHLSDEHDSCKDNPSGSSSGEKSADQQSPGNARANCDNSTVGKTLLELQQEVAMTQKCYSDYQRTQVLTSSMLRDVQKRFAKYYPDAAIPSRSTIKHVFEKCVAHGTVENMRTPRRLTKIPQSDQIECMIIHEPQLSLRQMAQKLNVSTGTVSRRCKALGLVPESVTIKQQQLATARRQKQLKQLESQSKSADGT